MEKEMRFKSVPLCKYNDQRDFKHVGGVWRGNNDDS